MLQERKGEEEKKKVTKIAKSRIPKLSMTSGERNAHLAHMFVDSPKYFLSPLLQILARNAHLREFLADFDALHKGDDLWCGPAENALVDAQRGALDLCRK